MAEYEVDVEDEIQDWRGLTSVIESIIPKRGEKDFEPDGTLIQGDILKESRQAMFNALDGKRGHTTKQRLKVSYFPEMEKGLVDHAKGPFFKTMGVADNQSRLWLNKEEIVYLMERGSVSVFLDGLELSLEHFYSLALEEDREIDQYQVYAFLKRHGYLVSRWDGKREEKKTEKSMAANSFSSIIFGKRAELIWLGLRNGLLKLIHFKPYPFYIQQFSKYTSYLSIFTNLRFIPHHNKFDKLDDREESGSEYRITFNVWKPTPNFKKSDPPKPDFQVVVINGNEANFPSLLEMKRIFEDVEYTHTIKKDKRGGNLSSFRERDQRLKTGYRNVLLAVMNHGVMNIVKLSEADFSCEEIWTDVKKQNRKRPENKASQKKNGEST